ncbi:MAG: DUF3854 domain-containing protein [Cyanobacteria bacterium P01_E01_bin.6]
MLTAKSINTRARREWIDESGVDEEIVDLNLKTSHSAFEGKRLTGWRSFSVGDGYWWCDTIEPRTGREVEVGELKLFNPTTNKKGKQIKYAAYPAGKTPLPGLLKISVNQWKKIAQQNNVSPDTIKVDKTRDDLGFWAWVLEQRLTVYVCEGRKKAAALLTHGYAAISIVGVWNGTKKWRGEHRRIVDGLIPFLQSECEIGLVYDSDFRSNPSVMEALKSFEKTLIGACPSIIVSMVTWGVNEGKGIDDLLVAYGKERLHEVISKREIFNEWIASVIYPDSFETIVVDKMKESGHHFIYSQKTLHKWNGTHYKPICDEAVADLISKQLKSIEDPDTGGEKSLPRGANNPIWNRRVLQHIKNNSWVDPSEINPAGHFNLLNEIIQIETNVETRVVKWDSVERSHDCPPYFDYCCDFEYNPAPNFQYWEQIKSALDEPYRSILFKTIASSIDLQSIREVHGRCVRGLFLLGDGNNGKDTAKTVIKQIFGSTMTAVSMSEIRNADANGDCNHLWPLEGSKLNWSSEAKTVRLDKTDILKAILTGDEVRVRRMHQNGHPIQPVSVMIFTSNNDPVIGTSAESIKSRYGIIRFEKTFVAEPSEPGQLKADPRFKDSKTFLLKEVAPAAFVDMLRTYKAVVESGIDYSPLDANYAELQEEYSHLSRFVHDIELKPDPSSDVSLDEIWTQLKAWYAIEEMAEIVNEIPRPIENDRYDPIVTSKRMIKKRLAEVNPKLKLEVKTERSSRRKSFLRGWRINNSLIS